MKISFNTVSAYSKAGKIQNCQSNKANVSNAVSANKANCEKLPSFYYQPIFKGTIFWRNNLTHSLIDYGEDLYIGAYGPPKKDPNSPPERYSVNRQRATARRVDLSEKDLSNYNFEKSSLFKCSFESSKLENTNLEHSNLWGSDFRGAKLRSVNLRHSNLCDVDFRYAHFIRTVDMSGANLMGADLRRTDLTNVNLKNAIYNETTRFPKNMPESKFEKMIFLPDGADFRLPPKPSAGREDEFIEERTRFEYAKMRHFPISNVDFANNSLKRTDLKDWRADNCCFENANLTRAYARQMKAQDCDFSGAKMEKINFDEAEFENVNMENADLRGAIFTFKSAENLNLKGAIYDQHTVFNDGFDPKKHGMKYQQTIPKDYYCDDDYDDDDRDEDYFDY